VLIRRHRTFRRFGDSIYRFGETANRHALSLFFCVILSSIRDLRCSCARQRDLPRGFGAYGGPRLSFVSDRLVPVLIRMNSLDGFALVFFAEGVLA